MDARERILAIDGMTQAHAEALISLGLDTYYEIHRLLPTLLVTKLVEAVAPERYPSQLTWRPWPDGKRVRCGCR